MKVSLLVPVLAVVAILSLGPILVAPNAFATSRLASIGPASFAVAGNNTCGCVPEALYITNPAPTEGVNPGDLVNVTYEWEIPTFHLADAGVLIHIPSIVMNFTVIKHPNLIIDLTQRNETIAGPGWSNASLATDSRLITTHFFFSTKLSYLSTQRIAVMSNVSYGTFRLEFRWQWSIWKPNLNATTVGNWSNNSEGPHHQDLITPSPLVRLASTTVRTVTVGGVFTARMEGIVTNQGEWLLEMEYPNGSVTTQVHEWGPNGTTSYFNATLPMETPGRRLPAGQYLVHVHTPHGAIIFSITVHLFLPATGTVTVLVSPGSCGSVSVNGTVVANGTNSTFPVGPVVLQAPSCPGLTFHSWSQSGGGMSFVAPKKSPTNATLYYNATLTATYV
ncbi:MAG: hypothetical protein L3K16_05205 [Thermoplasmata archaeon]|nr:hypothetical protein [Thermoplasmata archaeon]